MSARLSLGPAVALAAAGVVALGPALAASPPPAPTLPVMHLDEIRLAGAGQDFYNSVTPIVQEAVGGVSYLVNFVPLIGGPIAAQININYFQGVQPVVAATVNYLAAVVQDPVNVIPASQAYGATLYEIGDNYVSAQLRFLGLQPPAPLAATAKTGRVTAAATVRSAAPGQVRATPTGPVRAPAVAARTQGKSGPGAARSVARAGAATAGKRFG